MPFRTPEQDFARFRGRHDARALARVFDALAPELLLVAAHFARDAASAEDLVQATFVDAIRRAAHWDLARPLLPWLLGILANHARLERRRERRGLDPERLRARAPRAELAPDELAAQREVAEALGRALQGLPEKYRQALTLRLVHGMPPREIARVLGCPPATVKTRLQRGAALLRRALPVGLTAAAAGLATPGRGLAAVRAAVLAEAGGSGAAAAVGAAAVAGGGMAMKKIAVVAGGLLLALALWWVAPWTARTPPAEVGLGAPAPSSALVAGAEEAAAADSRVPARARTALARASGPPTGAARLLFTWEDDGGPAAGIRWDLVPKSVGAGSRRGGRTDAQGGARLGDLLPGGYLLSVRGWSDAFEVRAGEEAVRTCVVPPTVRVQGAVVDAAGQPVAGAVIRRLLPDAGELPMRVATSGADGAFTFGSDFACRIWAERPGRQPSAMCFTSEGVSRVQLVLGASGVELVGRVRAPGGVPVAGAAVVVFADPRRSSREDAPPVCVRTDGDGCFATRELAAEEHVVVVCDDVHAPAVRSVVLRPTEVTELVVELEAAAAVRGTVRDAQGAPRRARLEARPVWLTRATGEVVYGLLTRVVRADESGVFELRPLAPGAVRLEASQEGLAPVATTRVLAAGEVAAWAPVLGAGASITGRVVGPAGAPLVRWEVEANPIGVGAYRTTWTDHEGRFALEGLTAEAYRVDVVPELRFLPHGARELPYVTADLAAGATDVVLRAPCTLAESGAFRGRVVDASGAPVRGARIRLRRPTDVGALASAEIGADGCFRWRGLPPGDYAVHVEVEGHGLIALGQHTLGIGDEIDLGTIRAGGRGTARLRVVTDAGEAEGASVRMHDAAGNTVGHGRFVRALRTFEPLPDGTLRSPPVPAGTYTVAVEGETFAPQRRTLEVVAGGETTLDVVVAAATPVRLRFGVPARWRQPLRALVLQLRVEGATGEVLAMPFVDAGDPEHFVLVRGFAPGVYRVIATEWPFSAENAPRPLAGEARFTVAPGQRAPVDVEVALR